MNLLHIFWLQYAIFFFIFYFQGMGRAGNLLSLGSARNMKLKKRYDTSTNLFSTPTGLLVRSVVYFGFGLVIILVFFIIGVVYFLSCSGKILFVNFFHHRNLNSTLQLCCTETSND